MDVDVKTSVVNKKPNKEAHFCKLCLIYCTSAQALQEHCRGAKHQKKKQQLGEPGSTRPGVNVKSLLDKILVTCTEPIIGLQYVWEYRSPSRTVQPHYQCRLCKVQVLKSEIIAHIKGWKHCYRYMKKVHPDMVPFEEDKAVEDPMVRKTIKESAGEVEKAEGRGKIKVLMKEPSEVAAFQGMLSAVKPRSARLGGQNQGERYPPAFPDQGYPAENPQGIFPDFPGRMYSNDMPMGNDDFPMRGHLGDMPLGGYPGDGRMYESDLPSRELGAGPQQRYCDDFSSGGRCPEGGPPLDKRVRNDYEARPSNIMRREFESFAGRRPEGMHFSQNEGPYSRASEKNIPATLFECLENFRIETESDAQIVLKVTQKLTDVLMEYRLRTMSAMASSKQSSGPGEYPSSRVAGMDRYTGHKCL
ncbi:uncharacterized protein [Lepisosteus oculatus]|uniref:uncharacterized protein n=1 Tax=Lepisosteus oculatus TaxID=7918 RepID=UPI0035F52F49